MDKKHVVFSNSSASAVACCKKRMTAVIEKEMEKVKMVESALMQGLRQQATQLRKEMADEVKNVGRISTLSYDFYSDAGRSNAATFFKRDTAGGNVKTDGVALLQVVYGNMLKNMVDGSFLAGCSVTVGEGVSFEVSNGVATISNNTSERQGLLFDGKLFAGHIYYCSVSVCTRGGEAEFAFQPYGMATDFTEISDSWCRYSSYVTIPKDAAVAFEMLYAGAASECLCYAPLAIDLTELYGAGNEPSREECDVLYSSLPAMPRGITVAQPDMLKSVGYNRFSSSDIIENRTVEERYLFNAPFDITEGDEVNLMIGDTAYIILFGALQGVVTAGSKVELFLGENSAAWVNGTSFQVSVATVVNPEEPDTAVTLVRRLAKGKRSIAVVACLPTVYGEQGSNGYIFEGELAGDVFFTPLNPLEGCEELFLQKVPYDEKSGCYLPACAGYLMVEVENVDGLCVHILRDGSRSGYERYRESFLSFPSIEKISNYGLARVGQYADSIDFENWQYTKRVERIVLNGTEQWEKNAAENGFSCVNLLQAEAVSGVTLCDAALIVQAEADVCGTLSLDGKTVCVNYSNEVNAFTVEKFKAMLSKNPITLFYVLSVPLVYPITKRVPVDYLYSAWGYEEFTGCRLPLAGCRIFYMHSVTWDINSFFNVLRSTFATDDMAVVAEKIASVVLK